MWMMNSKSVDDVVAIIINMTMLLFRISRRYKSYIIVCCFDLLYLAEEQSKHTFEICKCDIASLDRDCTYARNNPIERHI